jgi:hypothetical protein
MTLHRGSWFRATLAWGALLLPAVGCSDDTDSVESDVEASDAGSKPSSGGKAGSSASGSKGGSGGAGGKAAGGAGGKGASSSGSSGSSAGAALSCGGETCMPNSTLSMIASTKACCTADDKCGQTNSAGDCFAQNAPGALDPACPTVDVDFMGMNYPQEGCCTPEGKCGGLFMQVGFGCLARENLLSDQGGPLQSISCGSGGDDADAGVSDSDAGM